ncbi:MAG: zinc ribbon domain-containing protein [Patescibacteria group bacterium]
MNKVYWSIIAVLTVALIILLIGMNLGGWSYGGWGMMGPGMMGWGFGPLGWIVLLFFTGLAILWMLVTGATTPVPQICPACGLTAPAGARFCPHCAVPLKPKK